jgi:hypothetical protein
MTQLVKKVHLGGAINECVLKVTKGIAVVEAIDITNSIVVLERRKIGEKDLSFEVGLGNLEILWKFLASVEDKELIVKNKEGRMLIGNKRWARKIDYLTTIPELISTRLPPATKQNPREKFKEMPAVHLSLDGELVKDVMGYLGALKIRVATIQIGKGKAKFILGTATDHRFEAYIAKVKNEKLDGFKMKVNGDFLIKILSVLDFSNEEELPTIGIAENSPLVLENGNTIWALVPLDDSAGEE